MNALINIIPIICVFNKTFRIITMLFAYALVFVN